MKTKISLLSSFLFVGISLGQMSTYDQKIELQEITEDWHSIEIPSIVFEKVNQNLSDIRIYGITREHDTIEAPYLLQRSNEKTNIEDVDFVLQNTTRKENYYYFTFAVPTPKPINRIKLNFGNSNFDWHVVLQGSQNQKDWYTILEDYRILAIKNGQTAYTFSRLDFPKTQYPYYRLGLKSDKKPSLESAKISLTHSESADYTNVEVVKMKVKPLTSTKQTQTEITLAHKAPLSYLKIDVADKIDYYRPISIQYLIDSVETEKGWKYQYNQLTSGTLTSIAPNEFKFKSTITQKLRLVIDNHDNQPLHLSKIETKGYKHQLLARFSQPAVYYLTYGKPLAQPPRYDVSEVNFKKPENLTTLRLGQPENISKKDSKKINPIFEDTLWLWMTMGVIIIVLGWFTLKMMLKK
tara:strand:- start:28152 stop:29378 length:1227 start_codon:yes stop_codon:yes gene_type:complete